MQSLTQVELTALHNYQAVEMEVTAYGAPLEADIMGISYTAAVCGGETIAIGQSCGAYAEIQVRGDASGLNGRQLIIRWKVGEEYHDLLTGTAKVEEPKSGVTTVKIEDAMLTAGGGEYTPDESLNTACTVGAVLLDAAGQLGVSLNAATASEGDSIVLPDGIGYLTAVATVADACAHLAAAMGGNAIINRSGELEVVRFLATTAISDTYSDEDSINTVGMGITGLTLRKINRITEPVSDIGSQVVETTEDYSTGTDEHRVLAECLIANQALADSAGEHLPTGVQLHSGRYSIPVGLELEPGDIITVVTVYGELLAPVCQIRIDWDGGVKSEIVSGAVPEKTEERTIGAGSLTTKLKDTADKVYRIQESVNGLLAEAANMQGQMTAIKQTAEQIIMEAVQNMPTSEDLDNLRNSLVAQIEVVAGQITLFAGTLNELGEQIGTNFRFSREGLYIGDSANDAQLLAAPQAVKIQVGGADTTVISTDGLSAARVNASRINIGDYTIEQAESGPLIIR